MRVGRKMEGIVNKGRRWTKMRGKGEEELDMVRE